MISEFELLRASDKRVAIAKDVLEHLEANKIIASSGNWLIGIEFSMEEYSNNIGLKEKFSTETQKCEACAIGGMFFAAVKLFNKLNVQDLSNAPLYCNGESIPCYSFGLSTIRPYLLQFFDLKQLMLIEIAFETGVGQYRLYDLPESEEELGYVASKFCVNMSSEDSMKLIMQNIIKNNGTFDPRTK